MRNDSHTILAVRLIHRLRSIAVGATILATTLIGTTLATSQSAYALPCITCSPVPTSGLAKPYISTTPATNVSSSTATVSGEVNSGSYPTTYWWEYGTTTSFGSRTTTTTVTAKYSGVMSAGVTGLQGGTTYYFRLAASYSGGTLHGATLSFQTLPAEVNLSGYNPPVAFQGPVNSCAAWAAMYYLRGWYAKRDGYYPGGPDSLGGFAPLFAYSQWSQQGSQGFNHGFNVEAAAKVMKAEGVDTRVDYWQGDFNQIDPPTAVEKANAANYKIASYALEPNRGGASMQEWLERTLRGGNPAAVGLNIYATDTFSSVSAATNYVVYPPPAGSPVVNSHYVFAYGYDQTGLLIENQWGTGWANHGYAKLSWAFVNQAVQAALSIVPITPPASETQLGTLVSTPTGSLYRITANGPEALSGYAAAGWGTEYSFTEDEAVPRISNGFEYDCTALTGCSAGDDDPSDPVIKSVQILPGPYRL